MKTLDELIQKVDAILAELKISDELGQAIDKRLAGFDAKLTGIADGLGAEIGKVNSWMASFDNRMTRGSQTMQSYLDREKQRAKPKRSKRQRSKTK